MEDEKQGRQDERTQDDARERSRSREKHKPGITGRPKPAWHAGARKFLIPKEKDGGGSCSSSSNSQVPRRSSSYFELEEESGDPSAEGKPGTVAGKALTGPAQFSLVDQVEHFDIGVQDTPREADGAEWLGNSCT